VAAVPAQRRPHIAVDLKVKTSPVPMAARRTSLAAVFGATLGRAVAAALTGAGRDPAAVGAAEVEASLRRCDAAAAGLVRAAGAEALAREAKLYAAAHTKTSYVNKAAQLVTQLWAGGDGEGEGPACAGCVGRGTC